METTNRQKAQAFLAYVAKNEKRLKKNLKKNVTYDADLFDDVFQESIIRCYNSIEKNGTDINDFEQYFFISSKWCYVQRDNQKRRRSQRELRDFFGSDRHQDSEPVWDEDGWRQRENSHQKACKALGDVADTITRAFGDEYSEIFIEYMAGKADGGTSYRKVAERRGLNASEVSDIIRTVKQYLQRDPRMNELKNDFYADDI